MESMTIEIKYKASIFGPDPEKPGESKMLFKNKRKRAIVDAEDIVAVIQYHGLDGKLNNDRCEIVHKDLGNVIVDTPFDIMSSYKRDNRMIVKGYKQYKQKK